MDQQGGDPKAQIEPYLEMLQSSDVARSGHLRHAVVAADPRAAGRGHRRGPGRGRRALRIASAFKSRLRQTPAAAAQNGGMAGKRVALALGSGGARGYAHIGVIDELRDRGYEIVGIAGSSMGALVGGLQAAGKLDEFADWAKSLTQRAVLRLLDPSITAAGVLRAEKILDAVRDILGEVTIEELPIPYTAVSTDLISGKSVWLQRGPVDAAIRASIAIPGVITPHVLDGRLLADGGILDPLPMAPIAAVNADLTIAVSLSGSEAGGRYEPTDAEPRATTEWLSRMWRSTTALFDASRAVDVPSDASDDELVDASKEECRCRGWAASR